MFTCIKVIATLPVWGLFVVEILHSEHGIWVGCQYQQVDSCSLVIHSHMNNPGSQKIKFKTISWKDAGRTSNLEFLQSAFKNSQALKKSTSETHFWRCSKRNSSVNPKEIASRAQVQHSTATVQLCTFWGQYSDGVKLRTVRNHDCWAVKELSICVCQSDSSRSHSRCLISGWQL